MGAACCSEKTISPSVDGLVEAQPVVEAQAARAVAEDDPIAVKPKAKPKAKHKDAKAKSAHNAKLKQVSEALKDVQHLVRAGVDGTFSGLMKEFDCQKNIWQIMVTREGDNYKRCVDKLTEKIEEALKTGTKDLLLLKEKLEEVASIALQDRQVALYLPKSLKGMQVLIPQTPNSIFESGNKWQASKIEIHGTALATTPGLGFRMSKDLSDKYPGDRFLVWDTCLDDGVDEGDGWVRFTEEKGDGSLSRTMTTLVEALIKAICAAPHRSRLLELLQKLEQDVRDGSTPQKLSGTEVDRLVKECLLEQSLESRLRDVLSKSKTYWKM